jgi:hypothetical protein
MSAQLLFDEPTHTYTIGGAPVPSVTQILEPLSNFAGIPRDVLDAKRALGQRVHLACQLDDEDDLDEDSIDQDIAGYLVAWRRFLREQRAVVIENERRVWSDVAGFKYAGTLDNVVSMHGRRWLIDKKTSISTPHSAGPQTAAYFDALRDPSVTGRAAVLLRPEGTYKFDLLDGADDWSVFVACITLHRYRKEHGL